MSEQQMCAQLSRRPDGFENIGDIALEVLDHLDAMVAYWDLAEVCVFANNAYEDWFGKSREEMIGTKMHELLGPLYSKNLPYIRAAYSGQVQVFERDISTPDGRLRHSLATYTPHIVDGRVQGIFVHVADVTPLKKLQKELIAAKAEAERLATHDFLTGLPNRVLLLDRVEQAIALARRTHHMVAVLSVDLDDFKVVNDTNGHSAGDKVLVEVASRLKRAVRETDSIMRLGGDEFIVLLTEIESSAQAEAMAQRILESLKPSLNLGDTIHSVSCSVGIALCPPQCAAPEDLIAESDCALYLAKRLGKNRYAFAQEKEAC